MSGLCAIKQVVLADRKRVAVRAVRASYSFLYKIVASVPVYGLRCLLRFGGKFAVYGGWAWGCVRGEARRREPLVRAAGVRSVRFALLLRWRLGRSEAQFRRPTQCRARSTCCLLGRSGAGEVEVHLPR